MGGQTKALLATAGALLALAPLAHAAPKGVIETFGEPGSDGGQLSSPAGVAVNQASGDVYLADSANQRIAQLTEDGDFVRAWGRDVVRTGGPGDVPTPPILVNERQALDLRSTFDFICGCFASPTGGTFTLGFEGETSAPIPYGASPAQVQSALEALGNIDAAVVTDNPAVNFDWTVELGGSLAGTDVPELSVDASGLEPPGTSGFLVTEREGSTTSQGPAEICALASSCQAGIAGADPGELSLGASPQLAIDQSDGSVYVADTGNHRVQRFSATGVFLDQLGTNGSGPGQLSSPRGVAVDPSSGDVYVADAGNHRVQRFDSSGAFKGEIGAEGSAEGQFLSPTRVAVDSAGRIYVLDSGNDRVQRFDNLGNFEEVFASGAYSSPVELAIDSSNDHVLIAGSSADASVQGVLELDLAGTLLDTHAANAGLSPGGVAVRSSTGRIYLSDTPNARVAILAEVAPPAVTIEPVTGSATFSGIVNPQGPPSASYRFEHSADGTEWTPLPAEEVPLGEGSADIAVTQSATGLDPNTTYRVRLVSRKAFNAATSISAVLTFTTDPVPPLVEPLEAAVMSDSSAWLGAEVDPRKAPTTFHVEYSTDPGFAEATSVPAAKDASVGQGKGFVLANRLIEGLAPATTYFFRVVASSAGGTTAGEPRSFTTLAPAARVQGLPEGRVWEKVSPAYKAGAHVEAANATVGSPIFNFRSQAAKDGNAIVFASEGKFDGEGGPAFSQYLARRGADGWSTEGISPRLKASAGLRNWDYYQWLSEDLRWGALKTGAALNPGDPETHGHFNLYLRDNETGAYRLIPETGDPRTAFSAASRDGHTVYFESALADLQGIYLLKRAGQGEIEPVGVLPGGAEVPAGIGSGTGVAFTRGFNPVSDDGSRAYFTPVAGPEGSAFGWSAPLYLREGQTTTLVSASERPGEDPTQPRKAHFLGASRDGSIAFFASKQRLTEKSNANEACGLPTEAGQLACTHLYRWEGAAPEGERLTDLSTADPQGSAFFGMTAISDDGTSAYFVAAGDLTGTGERGGPELYLWREGEGISLVAEAADQDLWDEALIDGSFRHARTTPNGRFLAFESKAQLSGFDTESTTQIYRYDSLTEKLDCVSCGTFSSGSRGSSWLLSSVIDSERVGSEGSDHLPASMSPDGRRIVFDSRDALVPEDTNGTVDVYEWAEGRLHLLSSGTSATASRLLDSSESLDDVFFTTEQRLVRSDQDSLRDLYDARVGGVPEPDVTPPCVAEECQGNPTPPRLYQTPASAGFRGKATAGASRRCAKGKVRRRGRCVRRKAGGAKRTRSERRAAR